MQTDSGANVQLFGLQFWLLIAGGRRAVLHMCRDYFSLPIYVCIHMYMYVSLSLDPHLYLHISNYVYIYDLYPHLYLYLTSIYSHPYLHLHMHPYLHLHLYPYLYLNRISSVCNLLSPYISIVSILVFISLCIFLCKNVHVHPYIYIYRDVCMCMCEDGAHEDNHVCNSCLSATRQHKVWPCSFESILTV